MLISKLHRRGKKVQVGDLVSFAHPMESGVYSIKRVVGLEGDWVCRDTPTVGKGMMIQVRCYRMLLHGCNAKAIYRFRKATAGLLAIT